MAIRRTAGLAIFLLLCGTQLANAEWNAGHWTNCGRWWGFGFGDGYHACPCGPTGCCLSGGVHHGHHGYHAAASDCHDCAPSTPNQVHWQASRIPALPRLTHRDQAAPQTTRQVRQPQQVRRLPSR